MNLGPHLEPLNCTKLISLLIRNLYDFLVNIMAKSFILPILHVESSSLIALADSTKKTRFGNAFTIHSGGRRSTVF